MNPEKLIEVLSGVAREWRKACETLRKEANGVSGDEKLYREAYANGMECSARELETAIRIAKEISNGT